MVARLTGICLIVASMLFNTNSIHAQTNTAKKYIKLHFDSSEIYLGDSIVLELEATGLLDPIDLTPLLTQATILRETTGTRIAVIGGKVVEIKLRRMDLIPNQTGVLVFGPLTAGDVTSNSVHVKVIDAARPNWQPIQNDLQIKTSLSPDSVWVNQQVNFTIELLHRYPLNNESITLPTLTDFTTREIISNRRTFKGENREWFRTEWQYLIFPKSSGSLNLGDIHWSGTVTKSRSERAEFSRSVQSLSLIAKAAPDRGQWWLPADNVQLTEVWSQPPTELRAGDELERTIKVQASGVLAGQIPLPVVPESRAVQQTLISSTRNETLTGDSVISTADFTYKVKAQSPIPVFLDTIRVPWWSTTTDTPKEAIIPARRINVGLPDRADVLSKVAMQDTGINRLKHWLQSTSHLHLVSSVLAAISALLLIYLWGPGITNWLRRRSQLQQHMIALRHLAQRGDTLALYQQLKLPQSRTLLAGAESDLLKQLEMHLFSPHAPQFDIPVLAMLKSIQQNAKVTGKRLQRPNALTRL